jgi:signal recognition particle subunit SRP19
MANPRIEEVEDDVDDPEEMDLDAFDFARPQQGSLQSSMDPSQMDPAMLQQLLQPQSDSQTNIQQPAPPPQGMPDKDRARYDREQRERTKHYQCLYPIYFDSSRARQEGRRVKKEEGVQNPLARDIVDALQSVANEVGWEGMEVVFEPTKTHPKDWANPGRVRVRIKQDGKAVSRKINNKHHLYPKIAEYLRAHPVTDSSPLRLRLQGLPMPKDNVPPKPAIPRGVKMGSILPLHSPALSGGGVSENFFKDMMQEMGGQMPEGMQGLANMANMAGGGKGGKQKVVRVRK